MSTINSTLLRLRTLLACILSLSILVSVIAHSNEHSPALDDSTNTYRVADIDFSDDFSCINIAVNSSVSAEYYTSTACDYPGHILYRLALLPEPRAPPRISYS